MPLLLNDVRRALLQLQPQQAEAAAQLLQELVAEPRGALSCVGLRGALAQLQQMPVGGGGDGWTSELENEGAAVLLQAWQGICAAAAVSRWSDCGGEERDPRAD